ncbi:hypothetical protein C8J57DRAFT_1212175 [Mycena rebaudengoi]|nr:hypothetical protein C8J57DRAFT_1212175 [Mycena rebaudengoi]
MASAGVLLLPGREMRKKWGKGRWRCRHRRATVIVAHRWSFLGVPEHKGRKQGQGVAVSPVAVARERSRRRARGGERKGSEVSSGGEREVHQEWRTSMRELGLPPVAATATAVDLTGDLRPRAVSRRPIESLKKFLAGWHGQRDGRDGSTGCGTCEVPTVSFSGGADIVNTFPLTETDMMQMTREKGWVRSERTETEAIKEV